MRMKDLPDSVIRLLHDHHLGVLATSGDAYPHTSLISIAFADDYSYLVFPTLSTTKKFANLQRNNRVSVLLDNRSVQTERDNLYALTIHGSAHVIDATEHSVHAARFLKVHPRLSEFLSLPDTAVIKVTFEKILLVEGVLKVREFLIESE